mmetsp:Transcript_20339/g.33382  ORF Transcript_20339/g.33382 Transcript_20339/m.33382 type:complete len:162 (-) Transcript_20339:4-489(-)
MVLLEVVTVDNVIKGNPQEEEQNVKPITMDTTLRIHDLATSPTMPKESEEGNREYKRQLLNPSLERFEHLVTQLKYRLQEGLGEAFYEIGREDNGTPTGLQESELKASVETLRRMATELGADITVLSTRQGENGKCAEVLVRKLAHDRYLDVRVAVAGKRR